MPVPTSVAHYHDIDLVTNKLINARMHPVTTAERTALGSSYNSGDVGVLVYDTTEKVFYVWDANQWLPISVSTQLFIEIQEAYDKYTKHIDITSTETVHTVKLISRDDTFIQDTIKYAHIHTQDVPSAQWTITHNLGKFPSVTIVDSTNSEVIGEVSFTSNNQVVLSFSGAFSGKAYLN